MKCAVHNEVDATGYCRNCGKALCAQCARPVRDVLYCEDCLATVMGHPASAAGPTPVAPPPYTAPPGAAYAAPPAAAMPGRGVRLGSPAAAFWLGLFPGLGAIYNGQYNKGLIQIAIFASIIVGLSSDLSGGLDAMLAIFLAGFVFYCAFEAMRTAQAKNAGEVPSDPLESWSVGRPVGPIILIGLGALLLLNNFNIFEFIHLGRLWPLILIGAGLYMFRNKLGGNS
jgi:cell wall-active antibiotic response 4TMS protein YvqF/B-box zinc finger protein